jgi:hypothetical protein
LHQVNLHEAGVVRINNGQFLRGKIDNVNRLRLALVHVLDPDLVAFAGEKKLRRDNISGFGDGNRALKAFLAGESA